MPSQDEKWIDSLPAGKNGTTLCDLQIYHLRDAHDLVGSRPKRSALGAFAPVTLKPQSSGHYCCFCCPMCYVSIPHGFSAIVSALGADVKGDLPDETWSAGFHFLSPEKTVDRLVSKQLMVFESERECKTRDAYSVHINVLIMFEIIDAKTFVLTWGAEKFDQFLRDSQEEVLRTIAVERNVEEMYDLFGDTAEDVVEELNRKFEKQKLGVHVHHFTVTNVRIPEEEQRRLQEITLVQSQRREKDMDQKLKQLEIDNLEGKKRLEEECKIECANKEEDAKVIQAEEEKKTNEVEAETKQKIAEIEATRTAQVQEIATQNQFAVSEIQSQITAMEQKIRSETEAEVSKIKVEAEAFCKKKMIEADIEVSARLANGTKALGEAEGVASAAFAARRAHEAEMKRLDILEQLVLKNNMVIATSQENTAGMNPDNAVVTEVSQQGLQALRAKLAEITTTSLSKMTQVRRPTQHSMA
mmetsp:Transcript_9769/g.25630  ORF Transcript_9769/g.25630 Transcript_9769/m.25630 type:complete len:471 (-) Transcript_9769:71-1483(-)